MIKLTGLVTQNMSPVLLQPVDQFYCNSVLEKQGSLGCCCLGGVRYTLQLASTLLGQQTWNQKASGPVPQFTRSCDVLPSGPDRHQAMNLICESSSPSLHSSSSHCSSTPSDSWWHFCIFVLNWIHQARFSSHLTLLISGLCDQFRVYDLLHYLKQYRCVLVLLLSLKCTKMKLFCCIQISVWAHLLTHFCK